ncbi:MAG: hypothetical protein C9356_12245 [Oleiphilus sp.]|nr:MAG: hypothetical protein C9356_12245 [Oleiphilus sp.]
MPSQSFKNVYLLLTTQYSQKVFDGTSRWMDHNLLFILRKVRSLNPTIEARCDKAQADIEVHLKQTFDTLSRLKRTYSEIVQSEGYEPLTPPDDARQVTHKIHLKQQETYYQCIQLFDDIVNLIDVLCFNRHQGITEKQRRAVIKQLREQFFYVSAQIRDMKTEVEDLKQAVVRRNKADKEQRMLKATAPPATITIPEVIR